MDKVIEEFMADLRATGEFYVTESDLDYYSNESNSSLSTIDLVT